MKPVEQTILGYPHGNCWAACLASILEVDINTIPIRIEGDDWGEQTTRWLETFGLGLTQWEYQKGDWLPPGYLILGADSPRGDWQHAVVLKDGVIVWDPSPTREAGVGTWRRIYLFQALDPAVSKTIREGVTA